MTTQPAQIANPRFVRILRIGFAGLALAAAAALLTQWILPANADSDSSFTASWTDSSQPSRADVSPQHVKALSKLTVSVDQTKNLVDQQALRVTIGGFAPTKQLSDGTGQPYPYGANFVQAMQCWGNPTSSTFNQTCSWGGLYGAASTTGITGIEADMSLRVSTANLGGAAPHHAGTPTPDPRNDPNDVPFVAVDGSTYSGREQTEIAADGTTSTTSYPLFSLISPSATNEVPAAGINADGTGTFDFSVQSSDSAPQLGCGTANHLRCWLVVVPRDDVWGGGKTAPGGVDTSSSCTAAFDSNGNPPVYGQSGLPQSGSPVNPACDYWANRVVVPLDFTPTGATCPDDAQELNMAGSDLLVSAMSSWQPALCTDIKSNFTFDNSPDTLSRSQLVDGTVDAAFTPGPVSAGELSEVESQTLASTSISYAPVAATSAVFAFTADGRNGRIESLHLTPRLVAKLLTQSYTFSVPHESSDDPRTETSYLPAANRKYEYWNQDPDFRASNPNWQDFISNPAIVLPGPYADDVIAQLWKWVVSDSDARAWLDGAADPWGMQINPYYRAAGDPAAVVPTFDATGQPITANGSPVTRKVGLRNEDGTPRKLADSPPGEFLKADESLVPVDTSHVRYPFGSIQAQPFAQDFASATKATFKANPGAKTSWDPNAIDSSGQVGAWVSSGPQTVGQRFTLAFTDAASAALYNLSTASLAVDNTPTTFTSATDAQVTAAMTSSAFRATQAAAVSQVDPSKTTAGQYPLTSVIYAAVNLTASDKDARSAYAKLIRQVTTTGQEPGSAVGQLPNGYVPLTRTLVRQAVTAASAIETYVPPPDATTTDDGYATDDYSAGATDTGSGDGTTNVAGGDGTTGTITATKSSFTGKTPNPGTPWAMRIVLIAGLIAGVLGSLLTPLLFRRRPLG